MDWFWHLTLHTCSPYIIIKKRKSRTYWPDARTYIQKTCMPRPQLGGRVMPRWSPLCTALPRAWEMLIYTRFIDFPLAKGHWRLCKQLYTLSMIILGDKYFWFTQEPKCIQCEINKACRGWERGKLETDRGVQYHTKGHWHHLSCTSIPHTDVALLAEPNIWGRCNRGKKHLSPLLFLVCY